MLTRGDDYPLHQTPEPMAFAGGDRNFYDRFFFNGYSADGSVFFAAALGVYPQLDIMDAAFCLTIDGVQHNLRASKRMGSERLDLTVGPISVDIVEPLDTLRIRIAPNDGPIAGEVTFSARHTPIEEPRFTRRQGPRLLMDYTRMTQNGTWTGSLTLDGQTIDAAGCVGTRDRSWGIRGVGAAESQPPPMGNLPQFWWLWMPLNFPDHATFFHSNDDGEGVPWNRRGVVAPIIGEDVHFDADAFDLAYHSGTRRVKSVTVPFEGGSIAVTPRDFKFYMAGLGYLHPQWGHGMDHGELDVAHDSIDVTSDPPPEMTTIHIQALADAVLSLDGAEHKGLGVVEQLFLGPHMTSGLTDLLHPAP